MSAKALYQITLLLCIAAFAGCAILKPVAKTGGAIVKTTGKAIQTITH